MKRWLDDLPRPNLIPAAWSKFVVRRGRAATNPTISKAIHTQVGKRQLLVDISTIYRHDARTGIQRLVNGELNRLLMHPPKGFVVRHVVATRSGFYRYVTWPEGNVLPSLEAEVKVRLGDVFFGLDLAAHIIPTHLPRLMQWKREGVSFRFIVYDLLPLQNPAWFSGKLVAAFRRWIKAVAILADEVQCISPTVGEDFRNYMQVAYGLAEQDIRVSDMAITDVIQASSRSVGLPTDFSTFLEGNKARTCLLMVGTLEPRKGYEEVLKAFEHLWRRGMDISLIIVGQPGWKTEGLQKKIRRHREIDRRLFWRVDLSDEALDQVYHASDGVILASHAEGLGLPLIEAIKHGTPVLYRDLPVFKSVLDENNGDATPFPIEATVDELANCIAHFLEEASGVAQEDVARTQHNVWRC
jgi:glycosyltransferase involved in cell wall biosynthesis